MCLPASMILLKDRVIMCKGVNHHRILLQQNGIDDSSLLPDFVKVELTPRVYDDLSLDDFCGADLDIPLDRWVYKVDQDYLPEWYVPEVDEARARAALKDWYKQHVEYQNTDAYSIYQKAGNYDFQRSGYCSTQEASNNAVQITKDNSLQYANDEAVQIASWNALQIAGKDSLQVASAPCRQKADIGTTQVVHYVVNGITKVKVRRITDVEANKLYVFSTDDWVLRKQEE